MDVVDKIELVVFAAAILVSITGISFSFCTLNVHMFFCFNIVWGDYNVWA
jgi:hypothetical protein